MNKKKKVPQIRFKGFSNAWEQRKLGSMAKLINGFAFKSSYFIEQNKGLVVLTPGNVKVGGGFVETGGHYWDPNASFPPQFRFQEGDLFVVMTDLTPSANVLGSPAFIPKSSNTYLHNQRLGKMAQIGEDKAFFYTLLCTPPYRKYIVSTASGTTVRHSSPERILNAELFIPKSKKEQKKIGELFQEIDSLITLHQRKYETLRNVKKNLLEKMFPKNGDQFPILRFSGFNDAWEQRKLGSLNEIGSAARVHKYQWSCSGIPFFRSSDVVAAYNKTENEKAFIPRQLYEKLSAISGKLEKGDILITGGGSIGIPYLVPDNHPLYSKDADLIWIKQSPKVNCEYLYSYITSRMFKSYIKSISHIGTIAHYTIEQVKTTPIFLPTIAEQKKIGALFRSLDENITLHQHKCESLKNIKKSLLEKMFV